MAYDKKITRTSAGLREALFDAMENLRDGNIDAQDAKALASLSQQICNTVSLEIEVAKLKYEHPKDADLVNPKPIQLGVPLQVEKK